MPKNRTFPGKPSTLSQAVALAWMAYATLAIVPSPCAADLLPGQPVIIQPDPVYDTALNGLNQLLADLQQQTGLFQSPPYTPPGGGGYSGVVVTMPNFEWHLGVSSDFPVAADADLTPLGDPAVLSDLRLQALASFTSGRDFVVGPLPAIIDTNGHDLTLAGNLAVGARLDKEGAGILTLTGINTWTEAPRVWEGVLRGDTGSLQTSIYNYATVEFAQTGDGTYAGSLGFIGEPPDGGAVLRKTGSGVLTLTAASDTRLVEVLEGQLALRDNAALGAETRLDVAVGATLDYSASTRHHGAVGLSGGGEIVLGANGLSLDLGYYPDASFAGTISGAGGLSKRGSATLTLTGANTYSGATEVYGGTLALASAGRLGPATVVFLGGGVFDISQADGDREVGSLAGGSQVILGANTLTVGGTHRDTCFDGRFVGSGGLVKTGNGKLVLGSFAAAGIGPITIRAGTLEAAPYSLGSEVINDGVLILREDLPLQQGAPVPPAGTLFTSYPGLATYDGRISGSGRLVKQGNGAVWLRGANDYQGGTLVEDGILVGDSASLPGDIVNRSGLAFYQRQDGTYQGSLSGDGMLLMYGPGTLTLAGNNTHTGGTAFSGTLSVAADGNLGAPDSPLFLSGGTLRNTADMASARNIVLGSGGGNFDTGSSNLLLTGVLVGSGDLNKSGNGALVLAGQNTYTGMTRVNGGQLVVDGLVPGDVSVAAGAALGGIGRVGGNLAIAGRAAPGHSVGTLSVDGRARFAPGSTLQVSVDATGAGSRIDAAGADLEGGTVEVLPQAGTYAARTTYALLATRDGISGRFDGATSGLAFLRPDLSYDTHNVYLTLVRNDLAYTTAAGTDTQRRVAQVFTRLADAPPDEMQEVYRQLDQLTATQAREAFDSIAGNGQANRVQAQLSIQNTVNREVVGRLALADRGERASVNLGLAFQGLKLAFDDRTMSDARPAYALDTPTARAIQDLWMRAYVGSGRIDGAAGASGTDLDFSGLIAGYDRALSERTRLGVMLSYNEPSLNQGQNYRLDNNGTQLGIYSRYRQGPVRIDGIVSHGWSRNDSTRLVTVGALTQTALANFDATTTAAYVEYGHTLNWPATGQRGPDIEPIAALQWTRHREEAYTERGAGALSLAMPKNSQEGLRSLLGVRISKDWKSGKYAGLVEGRVAWSHEFRDTAQVSPYLAGDPGATPFTVASAALPRDGALLGLGVSAEVADAWRLHIDLSSELNRNLRNHSLGLGLHYLW